MRWKFYKDVSHVRDNVSTGQQHWPHNCTCVTDNLPESDSSGSGKQRYIAPQQVHSFVFSHNSKRKFVIRRSTIQCLLFSSIKPFYSSFVGNSVQSFQLPYTYPLHVDVSKQTTREHPLRTAQRTRTRRRRMKRRLRILVRDASWAAPAGLWKSSRIFLWNLLSFRETVESLTPLSYLKLWLGGC